MIKRVLHILLLSGIAIVSKGQSYAFFLATDTVAYEVGEPIVVDMSWKGGSDSQRPVLPDTLQGLELVDKGKSSRNEDGTFHQKYTYLAFDTAYYVIEPQAWPLGSDTIWSNRLFLNIHYVPLDTADGFKPIVGPIDPPFSLREWLPYLLIGGGGLVVLGIAVALLIYFLRKKKKEEEEPLLPPYVEALNELEKLKAEGLPEKGKSKDFHFRLSAIFRRYVEREFGVPAMECTTDELELRLENSDLNGLVVTDILAILKRGDLVKFAKASSSIEQDEKGLFQVREFVLESVRSAKEEVEDKNEMEDATVSN